MIDVVSRQAVLAACLSLFTAVPVGAQTGTFRQVSGRTTVAGGGTLVATVELRGGALSGTGTIHGDVSNAARVTPGGSPGVLTVEGNYEQSANGVLDIDMAGPKAGTGHDLLKVSGGATLGGELRIVWDSAFTPALGAEFTVIEWSSHEGKLARVRGAAIAGGRAFEARAEKGGLVLAVIAAYPPFITLATGPGAPAVSTTAAPGASGVPMLQAVVAMADTGDAAVLRAITLQASGTGDDAAAVTQVTLYQDANRNGTVEPDDPVLATGSFAADDVDLTLTLAEPLVVSAGGATTLLVAYDLAGGITASSVPSPGPWPWVPARVSPSVLPLVPWWVAPLALLVAALGLLGARIHTSRRSRRPRGLRRRRLDGSDRARASGIGWARSGLPMPHDDLDLAGAVALRRVVSARHRKELPAARPWRRRPLLVGALAALLLAACGDDDDDDGGLTGLGDQTYQVAIVELDATGETADLDASVTGLPITGTQLTVTP